MSQIKGNALVFQSGGPSPAINASLCGVIQEAQKHSDIITGIYGAFNSTIGLLKENLIDLNKESTDTVNAMRYVPSSALGTCRYKVLDRDYERILEVLDAQNIRYVFVIGGNDSMDTADTIGKLTGKRGDIIVIGIPKTIDNDLPKTDHTPGFGSAAKYMAVAVMEAGKDVEAIYTKETVTIVECMGRAAGWLTAATGVAMRKKGDAPHLVYVPEIPFNVDKFVADVKDTVKEYGGCVVAASEGIRDADGNYLAAKEGTLSKDSFGNVDLGGVGPVLVRIVEKEIGVWSRYNLAGTFQRVGGHIASLTDINESYQVGQAAVKAAIGGNTRKMVSLKRGTENGKYIFSTGLVDLSKVANAVKYLPRSYMNDSGNHISDKMREYTLPLIAGDIPLNRGVDGLPVYARFKKYFLAKKTGKTYELNT